AMLPVPIRGSTRDNLAAARAKRADCRKANSYPTSTLRRLLLWPRTRGQPHAGLDRIDHRNEKPLARPGKDGCTIAPRSWLRGARTAAAILRKLRAPPPEHAPAFGPT